MNRIYCGNISNEKIGTQVLIKGWIKKNRKLGKLIFLDVSDRTGLIQVVLNDSNTYYNQVKTLPRESVVEILGTVLKRSNPNNDIKNGDIELELNEIKVDSIATTPPLIIDDNTDALEDVRMKYRYLDLRRPIMQKNLIFRSKVINTIRNFMIENDFVEVETPILTKSTPEGARDYLVPSRVHNGSFYALPQSPQIYKQLLMIAGLDRYFQVAKCFRDEDLRSDRQPEFTQLDIEMSFIDELDIQTLIEELLKDVFKKNMNIDIKTPFMRMDYSIAMEKYGCDKPDLRFGLELIDFTNYFLNSGFNLFANSIKENKIIKGIICDSIVDKSDIKKLDKFAKDMKAKELMWITLENNEIQGSFAKHIEKNIIENIFNDNNIKNGTLLLIVDKKEIANSALGIVRGQLGGILGLKKPNEFSFLWVVNWPLYEFSEEENKYVAAHHPFTQPQPEYHDTFDIDLKNAKARAYDVVLNGYEIGGGSIRITTPEMQSKMFKAIGLTKEQTEAKFGFLIDAYNYGAPPHGGLAIGLDRLIAIMLNQDNIKDCIAFPKNANAMDTLFKTPCSVDEKVLNELGIKIK